MTRAMRHSNSTMIMPAAFCPSSPDIPPRKTKTQTAQTSPENQSAGGHEDKSYGLETMAKKIMQYEERLQYREEQCEHLRGRPSQQQRMRRR